MSTSASTEMVRRGALSSCLKRSKCGSSISTKPIPRCKKGSIIQPDGIIYSRPTRNFPGGDSGVLLPYVPRGHFSDAVVLKLPTREPDRKAASGGGGGWQGSECVQALSSEESRYSHDGRPPHLGSHPVYGAPFAHSFLLWFRGTFSPPKRTGVSA